MQSAMDGALGARQSKCPTYFVHFVIDIGLRMNTETLQTLALDAVNDLKALDVVTFDVRDLTSISDIMIICSGRSNRHVKSIAQNVVKKAKEAELKYIKMEGEREGEWVIVDLADVIVHVMLPASREFYSLEDLWEPIEQLRENRHK